jgi:hypothetical protein
MYRVSGSRDGPDPSRVRNPRDVTSTGSGQQRCHIDRVLSIAIIVREHCSRTVGAVELDKSGAAEVAAPDGSSAAEVAAPDGSSAAEVAALDGSSAAEVAALDGGALLRWRRWPGAASPR